MVCLFSFPVYFCLLWDYFSLSPMGFAHFLVSLFPGMLSSLLLLYTGSSLSVRWLMGGVVCSVAVGFCVLILYSTLFLFVFQLIISGYPGIQSYQLQTGIILPLLSSSFTSNFFLLSNFIVKILSKINWIILIFINMIMPRIKLWLKSCQFHIYLNIIVRFQVTTISSAMLLCL